MSRIKKQSKALWSYRDDVGTGDGRYNWHLIHKALGNFASIANSAIKISLDRMKKTKLKSFKSGGIVPQNRNDGETISVPPGCALEGESGTTSPDDLLKEKQIGKKNRNKV